jgi:rfaE bifunctional protein nucleotidyltransferase chain/domain
MLPDIIQNKIWNRDKAAANAQSIRAANANIVFTNGVFDILHAGHVAYLAEAAALGDFLIVGVNSDASVKRLNKSPNRPLQTEISRSAVIASLQFVNAVVIFDEDTPFELISAVLPNVLVKGADYKVENIVGADVVTKHGGSVKTIAFIPGFSTTAIENKILSGKKS